MKCYEFENGRLHVGLTIGRSGLAPCVYVGREVVSLGDGLIQSNPRFKVFNCDYQIIGSDQIDLIAESEQTSQLRLINVTCYNKEMQDLVLKGGGHIITANTATMLFYNSGSLYGQSALVVMEPGSELQASVSEKPLGILDSLLALFGSHVQAPKQPVSLIKVTDTGEVKVSC